MCVHSQQASQQRSVGRPSSCLRFQNTSAPQQTLSLVRPWQFGQDDGAPGGSAVPVNGAVEQFGWVSSAGFRLQADTYLHCGRDTDRCKPGFCSDWSPSDLVSSLIPSQLGSWGDMSKLQHQKLSCGILNPS